MQQQFYKLVHQTLTDHVNGKEEQIIEMMHQKIQEYASQMSIPMPLQQQQQSFKMTIKCAQKREEKMFQQVNQRDSNQEYLLQDFTNQLYVHQLEVDSQVKTDIYVCKQVLNQKIDDLTLQFNETQKETRKKNLAIAQRLQKRYRQLQPKVSAIENQDFKEKNKIRNKLKGIKDKLKTNLEKEERKRRSMDQQIEQIICSLMESAKTSIKF